MSSAHLMLLKLWPPIINIGNSSILSKPPKYKCWMNPERRYTTDFPHCLYLWKYWMHFLSVCRRVIPVYIVSYSNILLKYLKYSILNLTTHLGPVITNNIPFGNWTNVLKDRNMYTGQKKNEMYVRLLFIIFSSC